jgi:hypothetical protein
LSQLSAEEEEEEKIFVSEETLDHHKFFDPVSMVFAKIYEYFVFVYMRMWGNLYL